MCRVIAVLLTVLLFGCRCNTNPMLFKLSQTTSSSSGLTYITTISG